METDNKDIEASIIKINRIMIDLNELPMQFDYPREVLVGIRWQSVLKVEQLSFAPVT
jgi:hypothetical protein